jgi:tRNA pseudouridine32 synthase/23S rRNA pseudouridine746 synthase
VVDKPAGLLAVPGRAAHKYDSQSVRVQAAYPQALVVHRLDQPTSGLMMFALDPATQSALGRMFQQREVQKEYIAVVAGRPDPSQGEVDLPLIADWPNRPRQRIDQRIGKPALTRYRVLEHDADSFTSRVRLIPVTGRTHQLRLHMAALEHPILGDELYADAANHARSARLLLHAHSLRFMHPASGVEIQLNSPVPF